VATDISVPSTHIALHTAVASTIKEPTTTTTIANSKKGVNCISGQIPHFGPTKNGCGQHRTKHHVDRFKCISVPHGNYGIRE
jgi:hypothetical protein